jgi:hypothetical protein
MAGTSLLALIDDIATLLDDVSVMSQVAAKKTAGVLGDDLALNAQQVAGVTADRELPVVWAVAVGSLKNKLILVPAALAISALAPWAVTPLLMLGGAFLCYEGFEKLAHKLMHGRQEEAQHAEQLEALANPAVDMVAFERDKIRGAIRTDFILSAEIITITLGTVTTAPFGKQVAVLSAVAFVMTVVVYGLVAGIVKLDDGGLHLSRKDGSHLWHRIQRWIGETILKAAPYLMKGLSIAGTAAMFMVGGGILTHGTPGAHDLIHHLAQGIAAIPGAGLLESAMPILLDAVAGLLAGALILSGIMLSGRVFRMIKRLP